MVGDNGATRGGLDDGTHPTKDGKKATIRDVANWAKVSLGTVSNVLNDPDRVAAATRNRVLDAIEATGFIRNIAARQLRGGGSKAIGIVILDSSNPFFTEMIRGAEDALRPEGYLLIACSTDGNEERETNYLRHLEEHQVEGVLITPSDDNLGQIIEFHDRGTPVVLVDRESNSGELCSVTVDDVKGGSIAVTHLIEEGHRKIVFINGPSSIRQCRDRRAGVDVAIRTLKNNSNTDKIEIVDIGVPALSIAAGEDIANSLLDIDPSITAIMCANDLLAIGVMRGITRSGSDLLSRIALVGYDDITFSSLVSPPLTSVRQPQYDLGHAAAKLLLEELADATHRHREIRFTPDLVVRESSCKHSIQS
ncbi:MAG: LacI family DNA-binding transcriptional regulator [Actinomycetota bacterium]|nr:LacI family DNA-binding transcriptional regulator [Actinomycetota bacterium]